MTDVKQAEATWYGELYAIHKLKVACARCILLDTKDADAECNAALRECYDIGLTKEILLERLKV